MEPVWVWPLGIVVLIYWFKPETKAWYENA